MKLRFTLLAFAFLLLIGHLAGAVQVATAPPDPGLASVFAGASLPQADLIPKPAPACSRHCLISPHYTTSTLTGSGSDCAMAQDDLTLSLNDAATTDCFDRLSGNICNFVVHAMACTLTRDGTYQVQGTATYNCSILVC